MARIIFKQRGLGAEPTVIRELQYNDDALVRAYDMHRLVEGGTPETNEQVFVRLILKWFAEEIVAKDYLSRKTTALTTAAAGITHNQPTIGTVET